MNSYRKKIFPALALSVVLILLTSLGTGIVIKNIIVKLTAKPILVMKYFTPATGIGGGCALLYDRDANSRCIGIGEELPISFLAAGPSPLYDVREDFAFPDTGNYKISTNDLDLKKPYFPMQFQINLSNGSNILRVGESYRLSANAEILDCFPSTIPPSDDENNYFVIPLRNEKPVNITFYLEAVSFDVAPDQSKPMNKILGVGYPASHEWIISPKTTAYGNQELLITIKGLEFDRTLGARFEVHSINPINPFITTVVGSVGTFLLGLFGLLKLIPEIWISFKNAFGNKKTSRQKDSKNSNQFE